MADCCIDRDPVAVFAFARQLLDFSGDIDRLAGSLALDCSDAMAFMQDESGLVALGRLTELAEHVRAMALTAQGLSESLEASAALMVQAEDLP